MAFLGYFNDGTDRDGDGIVDDLEIDVQALCDQPQLVYLTVYTDYDGAAFRKLSRVVDLSSGARFDTQSTTSERFVSAGTDSALVAPNVFTPDVLYELGFEWHADSIHFFLQLDGVERDVWTLTGAERVPQQPVHIVLNLWHPDQHWYPAGGAADYPANDVVLSVDWVTFQPE